ncbi:MAG: amidase [Desulfosalsimonas sp.]|uniref:amidase n=1 Tax=Desulfosalsimonas sp. TaxID=3073848 RepID=UPI0039710065
MNEPAFQSASQTAAAIRGGRISAVEMLDLYLKRVEQFNPQLNAIVQTCPEAARKRAQQADEALARGRSWGPLHGVPVTIKDTLEVQGMPCTSGAPALQNHMPGNNAEVVRAYLDAGAVIFGKTNVPLYGGDLQTFNKVYGQTNNPWNTERTPGGSSGGAAAALAAGLTCLEIGSDIGGSIRTPAHFCGIYGHKPSYGIVPQKGHIPPAPAILTGEHGICTDIMVVGPLARSIRDISLAMEILVAPEPAQRRAWQIRLPEARKNSLKDLKIGLWLDDPACPVDTSVADVIQAAVDKLAANGTDIGSRRPDVDFAQSHDCFLSLLAAVMGTGTPEKYFAKWREDVKNLSADDQSYLARHLRGATQLYRDWEFRNRQRQQIRQKWADFFGEFDVLICPAAAVPAIEHDHQYIYDRRINVNRQQLPYMSLMGWAGLIGVAHLPSTVVPAGRTKDGLPVGLQIVGPYLEDRTPIKAGELFADVLGRFVQPEGY